MCNNYYDDPLDAARGCLYGLIIGTAMWVGIIIGVIAIVDYFNQSVAPKTSIEKTLDGK